VTCPCKLTGGKQLPSRGDVMVCLGLPMPSTYRYPPECRCNVQMLFSLSMYNILPLKK